MFKQLITWMKALRFWPLAALYVLDAALTFFLLLGVGWLAKWRARLLAIIDMDLVNDC